MLHPSEGETCSKTGEFDESLALNNLEFKWLETYFRQRRRDLDGTQALFDLSYAQWAPDFRDAGDALGLAALGLPTLYQLRHGGASHELLTGARLSATSRSAAGGAQTGPSTGTRRADA